MKTVLRLCVLLVTIEAVLAATFEVKTTTDRLEIGENLGNVMQAIGEQEFPELKSTNVRTRAGEAMARQYIRFQGMAPLQVRYQKNEENEIQDFLYASSTSNVNDALFEYELEFSSGLKSNVKDGTLEDYIGEKVYIFADEYTIVHGKKEGNDVTITFLGGGVSEIVNEGTARTFTVGGTDYNVNVLAVEDSDKTVRLKVNNLELTRLKSGESAPFSDVVVGISKILFSSSPTISDIAEVFVGKRTITAKDNVGDTSFSQTIEINKQRIINGYIQLVGSLSGTTFSLTDLKYRLTPERDIFIKSGERLSQHLPKKEYLLGDWDIVYNGLANTPYKEIKFIPTANSEYTLTFTNRGNQIITVPFITNKAGTFKLGDNDQDLLITEGSASNFNVDLNDYFVLTNRNDKTGDTYLLRYDAINTGLTPPTITLYELASGQTKTITYESTSGTIAGNTTVVASGGSGAITSRVLIGSATNNPLAVDLDGDGTNDGSTVVDMVTAGGGILDLSALSGSTYSFNVKTERNQFEEASSEESVSVTIEARSGNTIGIQSTFGSLTVYSSASHRKAMSNYGVKFDLLTPANNNAETLTISYPQQQVFANVYIELGSGTLSPAQVSEQTQTTDRCSNGVLDGDETGIDCGGSCQPCVAAPTCSDNIKNQDEENIDCGGSCLPCVVNTTTGCDGCAHVDAEGATTCLSAGTLIGSLYCGKDKKIQAQKKNGEPCGEHYECTIGICEEGTCGKHITWTLLVVNIGVVVIVLIVLFFAVSLMRRQPF